MLMYESDVTKIVDLRQLQRFCARPPVKVKRDWPIDSGWLGEWDSAETEQSPPEDLESDS